jgi:SAM-dependent methyltransferase
MIHKDIIALNLGCGPSGVEGWVNYDYGMLPFLSKFTQLRRLLVKLNLLSKNYDTKWPKIKLVDIRNGIPMEDGTVDYIYCSHVLEHFEKYETINILKECFRVLKIEGIIRIVLPDLKIMTIKYKDGDKFCRDFYGFDKDIKTLNRIFIRGHQWMYDEVSFGKLIGSIFKRVDVKSCGKGKVPDLDKLDLKMHMDHSFYIEATK